MPALRLGFKADGLAASEKAQLMEEVRQHILGLRSGDARDAITAKTAAATDISGLTTGRSGGRLLPF